MLDTTTGLAPSERREKPLRNGGAPLGPRAQLGSLASLRPEV